jgi:tetratricopeptide (TPR) repeat protein/DNA-binding MarR family transcriptional regulator
MKLSSFNLTIEDGIVVHLFQFLSFKDEIEVPFELTQPGIADTLNIRRSHVSYSINSLKKKGYVFDKLAHVKFASRKRKVYFLTSEGANFASRMKTNLNNKVIIIKGQTGQETELTISEFREKLKIKNLFLKILTRLPADKILSIKEIEALYNEENLENFKSPVKNEVLMKDRLLHYTLNNTKDMRFYGRAHEINQITKWLEDDQTQIIVLKGIPGIGKTTLAGKIANEYIIKNKISLFWYKFHTWDTIRSSLSHLADFLFETYKKDLKAYLDNNLELELYEIKKIIYEELKEQKMILIFDDFQNAKDKVLEIFSILIELLESGQLPGIKLIILSRKAPSIYDRRKVALKKIVVEHELTGLDLLSVKKMLTLNGINDTNLNRIYHLTEGHPLTLELIKLHVSSKMKNKNSKFDSALNELFSGENDISKYLKEEIFSGLSNNEKKLLNFLSVFRYSTPHDAIFFDEEIEYEIIDSLINKSLIHDTSSGFDIHELIREFFYHRLSPNQKKYFYNKAAKYYASELNSNQYPFENNYDFDSNLIIEAQHQNLMAGNFEETATFATRFGDELISRGYFEEFRSILDQISSEKVSTKQWAELLVCQGQLFTINGQWDKALSCYQESLNLCKEQKDNCGIARASNDIGGIYYRKGEWEKALDFFQKGLKYANGLKNKKNQSKLFSNIALIHWGNKEFKKAIDLTKKSLSISEEMGDLQGIARAYNNLGIIYWEQKLLDESIQSYNKSLELSERLGDKRTIAILNGNLGEAYRLKNETKKADKFYRKSLKLSEDLGFKWQIAEVHFNQGLLYKTTNQQKSKQFFETALLEYTQLGAKREIEKINKLLIQK